MFAALVRGVGARFRLLGWSSLGVLAVTGVINLAARGIGVAELSSATFWQSDFGRALMYKLTAVVLVVVATAVHDLLVGKRALGRIALDPRGPAAVRSRRIASFIGRATLLLSLVVLLFAVWLVRGIPRP